MHPTRQMGWVSFLVCCCISSTNAVQLDLDMNMGDSADVLRSWHLTNPLPPFEADPYTIALDAQQTDSSEMVCGTKLNVEDMSYELITFKSEADARSAGENVAITHAGSCGACSTLADLAVYLNQRDLTTPVRRCGFLSFLGEGIAMNCLRTIGFTETCASIWYYNTQNTRKECLGVCIRHLFTPNNLDDGTLNPCLQCDEDKSGPVFKAKAARTRRNSGIQSAIGRPDAQVYTAADHHAYLGPLTHPTEAPSHMHQQQQARSFKPWQPPAYGSSLLKGMAAWTLAEPFGRLFEDPYQEAHLNSETPASAAKMCAVLQDIETETYTLRSFLSEQEARDADAVPTHGGECAACSTLQDLSVYVANADLTTPVRLCAFKSFVSQSWAMRCLIDLGFTPACADVWYFNAQHTRRKCLGTCLFSFLQPNNYPDGSLSPCIRCDEEISGPVFKRMAGRTRRNSGLVSHIHRPGVQLVKITHTYWEQFGSQADGDTPGAAQARDEL